MMRNLTHALTGLVDSAEYHTVLPNIKKFNESYESAIKILLTWVYSMHMEFVILKKFANPWDTLPEFNFSYDPIPMLKQIILKYEENHTKYINLVALLDPKEQQKIDVEKNLLIKKYNLNHTALEKLIEMNNMLLTQPYILNTSLEDKKKMLMPYHNHFQEYYSMAEQIY